MGIKFQIDSPSNDYCDKCQHEGPARYGVKMHRGLPTQTWLVNATFDAHGLKWVTLCSDCLSDACKSGEVDAVLEPDGSPFTEAGKMFIRKS